MAIFSIDNNTRRWMTAAKRLFERSTFIYFRNTFQVTEATVLDFDYSGDERVQIFLDGEKIGDGPERGTPQCWFMGRISLPVEPGQHVLTARLLALGDFRAYAQMTLRPGFYVSEHSALLGDWEYQPEFGGNFLNSATDWGSYGHIITDESFNWQALEGAGGKWLPVEYFDDNRPMAYGTLPPLRQEEATAYRREKDCFVFDEYVNVYGDYVFSGSGEVRLRWAEQNCSPGGVNEEFMGTIKPGEPFPCFSGTGDRLLLTGGRYRWQDYWWHSGCTLQMTFFGDVTLEKVTFRHTGYPLQLKRDISHNEEPRLNRLLTKSWHTLRCCTMETLLDCPYYEQLQYISDSRFDMLTLYTVSDDMQLIEKALQQFAQGQYPDGSLSCRYPCKDWQRGLHTQKGELFTLHIPSFSAFYLQMLHDYARQPQANVQLIQSLLPVCRRVAEYFLRHKTAQNLLELPGWNFIDWRDNWVGGVPPYNLNGGGCTLNMIITLSFKQLASLEEHFGDSALGAKWQAAAQELSQAILRHYWDDSRQCYSEDLEHRYFSEHAQVFGLLALDDRRVIPALEDGGLEQCNIAFSFYYLEACRIYGLEKLFQQRRELYLQAADRPAFSTMTETYPTDQWQRSECHAWSSHLLYHTYAKDNILSPIIRGK